jgi:hypothetical protein
MAVLRTLAVVLAMSLSPGCFVLEELDNAQEMMENPSFGKPAKKQPSRSATPSSDSGASAALSAVKKRLDDWWGKARTLTSEEIDDDLVRCDLPEGTRFMNRNGCLHEGGVPRPPRGSHRSPRG